MYDVERQYLFVAEDELFTGTEGVHSIPPIGDRLTGVQTVASGADFSELSKCQRDCGAPSV